jgi:anti-anti-sigma regulatory factor
MFLDSSGINALVRIRDDCVSKGGTFRLRRLQPQPRRAVELVGLADHLGIANEAEPTGRDGSRRDLALESHDSSE